MGGAGWLEGKKKRSIKKMNLFYTLGRGWLVGKKKTQQKLCLLYPQAVSNRCCGNENPESWATRR